MYIHFSNGLQYCTVKYSAVQYCTVKNSAVQYSTVLSHMGLWDCTGDEIHFIFYQGAKSLKFWKSYKTQTVLSKIRILFQGKI